MSIKYYMKKTNFPNTRSYHARTVVTENVNQQGLVDAMVNAGSSLTAMDIRSVFELMKKEILIILARGASVEIDDFLRLKPRIKAITKDTDEGEVDSKPEVKIGCSISSIYTDSLRKFTTFEKTESLSIIPSILKIYSGLEKKEIIQSQRINNIAGTRLKSTRYELSGLKIFNIDGESIIFNMEQLAVDYHTEKLITFTFSDQNNFPDWLVDDLPISVRLIYTSGDETLPTPAVDSVWKNNS